MTATRQPDSQPAKQPAYTDSTEAAQALGISLDALRHRIARGTLEGYKEDGRWYVRLPDNQPASDRPTDRPNEQTADQGHVDSKELALAVMEAQLTSLERQFEAREREIGERLTSLERQLEAREREVGQLHLLLAQTALNQAPAKPWWKIW